MDELSFITEAKDMKLASTLRWHEEYVGSTPVGTVLPDGPCHQKTATIVITKRTVEDDGPYKI